MRNAVKYKDCWLMKGSKAYELYQLHEAATDPKVKADLAKKLANHMKELDAKEDALRRK